MLSALVPVFIFQFRFGSFGSAQDRYFQIDTASQDLTLVRWPLDSVWRRDYNKVNLKVIFNIMKNHNRSVVGLKELRENIDTYINAVERGRSFIVVRKSKPVFKISSPEEADELWEQIIDFTKIKKGGVAINQILGRL